MRITLNKMLEIKNITQNLKYTSLITDIVPTYAPDVNVIVKQREYIINKKLTQSQAVYTGRAIAHKEIGQFFHMKPVLFKSNRQDKQKAFHSSSPASKLLFRRTVEKGIYITGVSSTTRTLLSPKGMRKFILKSSNACIIYDIGV